MKRVQDCKVFTHATYTSPDGQLQFQTLISGKTVTYSYTFDATEPSSTLKYQ